ncbi:hypothetical protein CLAFUW4_12866 [Fulvia fulva]|uniref:F-box domain-containing protein n=1 Tax=Passalora fulva TaxID=5499 RepID=A0A9Q8UV28_PASFU|nr:uncharacterized protein CLAFUR5_12732 [Fulvia fulva]KAK4612287.1 hypothetical protein CLAFUR4_12870 [Fulvia fulva]KAK4612950.1 hypothetical protein CLAFUR0_12876 [Fulvia fulva]UJO23559.1 hypothetical protein CLAFUR5_12732 [Fulvia fulva]WPV21191.1 hypothetical protein CLAFUW4_12866 [Fulvia fulva]WPV36471.1 hypothetical protein CLAFUW7_12873 [Fulvia fulva]
MSDRRSLLDLPPELWSHIGKLSTDAWIEDWWSPFHSLSESLAQPPIAQTCRTLRGKLLPYFFRRNELFTDCWKRGYKWTECGRFLRALERGTRRLIGGWKVQVGSGKYAEEDLETMKDYMDTTWSVEYELELCPVATNDVNLVYRVKFL